MNWMNWKKILLWTVGGIVIIYVALVIARVPNSLDKIRTAEQVAKIHATKLTLDDVLGKNLPPDPGAEAGKTIAGIDANKNGIRDDVELAIFKEYPNSAKTRAVLLQYALALQMEAIQPIVNKDTVTEVIREESRAFVCIGDIVSREDLKKFDEQTDLLTKFVKERQLNTQERKEFRTAFYEKVGSYASLERLCDLDYSTLPN
ncbi:MAG: hypothetical protein WC835_00025 [Candidatus Paceibacterota bacterium]|jgi:hypothetical protein